jgi:hypothetical protein
MRARNKAGFFTGGALNSGPRNFALMATGYAALVAVTTFYFKDSGMPGVCASSPLDDHPEPDNKKFAR